LADEGGREGGGGGEADIAGKTRGANSARGRQRKGQEQEPG